MEEEKPTPKKFKRNCDTPLIDELGDLSPLEEMRGPKVPSNRQVLRFFLFLLSVGTELSEATGLVVEKVLAKHTTATAKCQRRLEDDVSDLLKQARFLTAVITLFIFYENLVYKNIKP